MLRRRFALIVPLAATLTGAPGLSPAGPIRAEAAGSIRGTARYTNGDPDRPIQMRADPICVGLRPRETVLTETIVADGQGRLANVLVYVKDGPEPDPAVPAEPVVLDQQGCVFKPHVLGVVVGQTLVIRNSDPTLHNVHAHPVANEEFDLSQPFQGLETERVFDSVEVAIPIRCDVHPWMAAYVAVLPNPFFAVSAADGSFAIDGLPPGEYGLEAWHEELGTQQLTVTVEAGQTTAIELRFAG